MEILATIDSGIGPSQGEMIRISLEPPSTLALEFPNSARASAAADVFFAQQVESLADLVSPGTFPRTLNPSLNQVAAASSDGEVPILAGLYVVATGLAAWQHLMFDAHAGRLAADEEDEEKDWQDSTDRSASPKHENRLPGTGPE